MPSTSNKHQQKELSSSLAIMQEETEEEMSCTYHEDSVKAGQTRYVFQVEKFRLIAYIAFWFMCFFAIVVTTFAVAPNLGPCPKEEGAEPTYGMHCSVLMKTFGFNNVSIS